MTSTRAAQPSTPPLRRSHGGLFSRFCREMVVHGEGDLWGQPFVLRPDQELWAWRWFELDEVDSWWFERGYLEAPKGSGKTMLLAAVALFELFGPVAPPHPNIPVAAAGQDQAQKDGIYKRICQILEHDNCPLKPYATTGWDLVERVDRPGQIRCIPANGNTTDGGLPTLFIADEVQDWFHTAADAHERNENSTTKREAPVGRSLSASTPGQYAGDGSVGWRLHNYGRQVRDGVVDDPRFLFVSQAAAESWDLSDAAQLEAAIREANVGASDRKVERLCRRHREIPEHRFRRFHLGQWPVSDGRRWMDMEAFARLDIVEGLPDPGSEVVAAFDGSINDDATGIVGATVDGRLFVIGCWEKPEFGGNWQVPRSEVDAVVAEMFATWKVRTFGCDPSAWRTELESWVDLYGVETVIEVPPSDQRMAPACDEFLADVMERRVSWDGDPRMFDHIRNAVPKRTRGGVTIRKEGPESPRKIDLAVCAVMANDLRRRHLLHDPKPQRSKALITF
jgi:phage terminase large subunit-like protein